MIARIKALTDIPVAVLTNGSLVFRRRRGDVTMSQLVTQEAGCLLALSTLLPDQRPRVRAVVDPESSLQRGFRRRWAFGYQRLANTDNSQRQVGVSELNASGQRQEGDVVADEVRRVLDISGFTSGLVSQTPARQPAMRHACRGLAAVGGCVCPPYEIRRG